MTLRDLLETSSINPQAWLIVFASMPILGLISSLIANRDASLSPWNYFFSFLIYACCIPGIFTIGLDIYLLIVEKRSILDFDLILQVLPIVSMLLTLFIISRTIDLDLIPGFGKLSGLLLVIACAIVSMWILDRIRIVFFARLPIQAVVGILLGIIALFGFGFRKIRS